jgi:ABC-type transport system involved in multi-copper enzyme maturation permease subunit
MKALMWKEYRENRVKLIIGCALLAIAGAAISIAYHFFESGIPGLGQMPPEVLELVKKIMPDFSNVNAYLFSQWFTKNLQQLGGILTVVLLGSAVASERELHTAIFLYSRPVTRSAVLAAKTVVLFAGLAVTVVIATAATVLGAVLIGRMPGVLFILSATLHSIVALLTFASLATLFSVLVADRIKAILLSGGTIILLSVAGQFRGLGWLNPLALFGSSGLIAHPTPQLVPLAVGIVLSAAMLALANRFLQRQEF